MEAISSFHTHSLHHLLKERIINVYDKTGDGLLHKDAAKRFLFDALNELDHALKVSDTELDAMVE